MSGICVLTGCNSGYYNILGTCIGYNLQTDENNCGAVGAKCSFNNGYGICSAGVCTFTQCLTGFALSGNKCNAVDTRSDVNNCGSVGNRCQSSYLNGGVGQCISGLCFAACSSGYTWDSTWLFCVRLQPSRRCLLASADRSFSPVASNLERYPQLRWNRQVVRAYRSSRRHVRQRKLLRHRLPIWLLARLGILQQD